MAKYIRYGILQKNCSKNSVDLQIEHYVLYGNLQMKISHIFLLDGCSILNTIRREYLPKLKELVNANTTLQTWSTLFNNKLNNE